MTGGPFGAWSKSGVDSLTNGCPWQVYLKKVVGLPDPGSPATALGTAYHAGVELHERSRLVAVRDGAGAGVTLDRMVAHAVETLGPEAGKLDGEAWALHHTDLPALATALEVALTHWWSTPLPAGQPGGGGSIRDRLLGMRPIAVEPYFRVPVAGTSRPLHGFIDELLWDYDDRRYVVVDHKSAGSFGRWAHDGIGHELEAAVYVVGAMAARSLPPDGRARMEWHITRKEPGKTSRFQGARVVTMDVDDLKVLWMGDHLTIADRIVDEGRFETNPGWNLCSAKWCFAYRACQVTGELAPGGPGLPVVA